jgi:hypothetical protein
MTGFFCQIFHWNHGKIPRIINYPDVLRREYSKTDKLIQWPNEKGQKDKQLSIKDYRRLKQHESHEKMVVNSQVLRTVKTVTAQLMAPIFFLLLHTL